jgi:hypothetical protein
VQVRPRRLWRPLPPYSEYLPVHRPDLHERCDGAGDGSAVVGQRQGSGSGHPVEAVKSGDGGGAAIYAVGRIQCSSVGTRSIGLGASDSGPVANALVGGSGHISVSLLGDAGVAVSYVERNPGTGFTVHLTGAAGSAIDFAYFIVDPA